MQQAITTPALRSVVVGALLLGLGGFAAVSFGPRNEPVTRRLVLHAVEEPNAIYLSAWRNGDLLVTFGDDRLRPITFTVRARISDGCRWLGTETLEPIDATTYAYDYSEKILSCERGAEPYAKTPRKGYVTVEAP